MEIPVYYINLDRRPDCRTRMEARLSALAIKAERIPACTRDDITDDILQARDALASRQSMTDDEIACCMSHRRALLRFLEGDAPMAVILEDDALLAKRFCEQIALLKERSDFDIVQLEACNKKIRIGMPGRKLANGARIHPVAQTGFGSAAYLITRHGAKLYMDQPFDLTAAADRWLFDMRFHKPRGVRAVQLVPGIGIQEKRVIPAEYGLEHSDILASRHLRRSTCKRTGFPHFENKVIRRSLRPIFLTIRFFITLSRTGLTYYRGRRRLVAFADGVPAEPPT